jgi:hypothetical protein
MDLLCTSAEKGQGQKNLIPGKGQWRARGFGFFSALD